jgi:effector-binding domain-containing protein
MKALKYIAAAAGALVALLAVVGFALPSKGHVERTKDVDAPACTVYALVDSMQRFGDWSPWSKKDPKASFVFSGPARGVGNKVAWHSETREVGSGTQVVTEALECKRVVTSMSFEGMAPATATIELKPRDGGVKVVWGFDTDFGMNLMGRYFGLMFDKMVGPDFEQGLGSLKTLAEALPKDDFAGLAVDEAPAPELPWVYMHAAATPDAASIQAALAAAFPPVMAWCGAHGVQMVGAPIAVYTMGADGSLGIDVGLPLSAAPAEAPETPILAGTTPTGKALHTMHTGPYAKLFDTGNKVEAWAAAHGMKLTHTVVEQYADDPATVPEDKLRTEMWFALE